eukprot:3208236-Rhodomonas_salina.1
MRQRPRSIRPCPSSNRSEPKPESERELDSGQSASQMPNMNGLRGVSLVPWSNEAEVSPESCCSLKFSCHGHVHPTMCCTLTCLGLGFGTGAGARDAGGAAVEGGHGGCCSLRRTLSEVC